MNELLSDAKAIVLGLLGLIVALVAWFSKSLHDRVNRHLEDHDQKYVTTAQFDKMILQLNKDRDEKHQVNVATLGRIEKKIDENEGRAAATRHTIRDKVATLTTEVAVLNHRLKDQRDT